MRGRARWIGSAAVIGAVAVAVAWWRPEETLQQSPPTEVAGQLTFGGPFALLDHMGRPVTEKDFLGHHQLVFFGFTSCPAVCPTTLQTVTVALSELGSDADRIQPMFITIDPANDTPQMMAAYVKHFDKRIVGLTGTPEQVARAAKAWHIHYRRVRDKDGSEQIEHTAALFLMGPDGKYLGHIPPDVSPQKMAQLIRMRLDPGNALGSTPDSQPGESKL